MNFLTNFKTIDFPESVQISPDNRYLVSFLTNDTTTIRDISSGEIIYTIQNLVHTSLSPDGKYLIGQWEDNQTLDKGLKLLKLFSFPEMIPIRTIDMKRGVQFMVSSIQYSPKGDYFAVFIEDMDLDTFYFDIFKLMTSEKIRIIKCEENSIISQNWSYIIQASNYNFVIQDFWTEDTINRIEGDKEYLWTLTSSPNENYLVAGYGENLDGKYGQKKDWYMKSWEIRTGRLIQTYNGSKLGPCSAVFSLDEKYLVAGWEDGFIYKWNFLNGKELLKMKGFGGHISSMSVSQDGNYLIASSYGNKIKIWSFDELIQKIKFKEQQESKKESHLKNMKQTIEDLIKNGKYSEALKSLKTLKIESVKLNLNIPKSWIEESIELVSIPIIKETILNLGTRFNRIQIAEISEVTNLPNDHLIISTVKEMIENNQIHAQYFSSTKSIAFDQEKNIDEIDKLMMQYKQWEEEGVGKK